MTALLGFGLEIPVALIPGGITAALIPAAIMVVGMGAALTVAVIIDHRPCRCHLAIDHG